MIYISFRTEFYFYNSSLARDILQKKKKEKRSHADVLISCDLFVLSVSAKWMIFLLVIDIRTIDTIS